MTATCFKIPSQHLPDSCQESTKIPQDSVSVGRGSKPKPREVGELPIVTFGAKAPTVTLLLETLRRAQQPSCFIPLRYDINRSFSIRKAYCNVMYLLPHKPSRFALLHHNHVYFHFIFCRKCVAFAAGQFNAQHTFPTALLFLVCFSIANQ